MLEVQRVQEGRACLQNPSSRLRRSNWEQGLFFRVTEFDSAPKVLEQNNTES